MNNGLLLGSGRKIPQPLLLTPKELAYASGTAAQSGITTVTDITGLTITFTVGQFAVEVELFVPYVLSATAAVNGDVQIADNANAVTAYGLISMYASGAYTAPGRAVERITTPGTYTRKGRIERLSGTGTISVSAGVSTTTSYIKATEIRRS